MRGDEILLNPRGDPAVSRMFRQVALRKELARIYETDPVFCCELAELRETHAWWTFDPTNPLRSMPTPAILNFIRRWGINFEEDPDPGHQAVWQALMQQKLEFSSAFMPWSWDQRSFVDVEVSRIRIEIPRIPPLEDQALILKLAQILFKEEMASRIEMTYSDFQPLLTSKRDLKYVEWTKLYQCGEPYAAIARSSGATRPTVSNSVKRVAEEMDLILRPTSRGGRPRTG